MSISTLESDALAHVSFAEQMTHDIPGISSDTTPRPIYSVGIVEAGTMGGGIAMNFVNVGIPVTLLETSSLASFVETIREV